MKMKKNREKFTSTWKNIVWLEPDPFKFETSLNISKHTFAVVTFW